MFNKRLSFIYVRNYFVYKVVVCFKFNTWYLWKCVFSYLFLVVVVIINWYLLILLSITFCVILLLLLKWLLLVLLIMLLLFNVDLIHIHRRRYSWGSSTNYIAIILFVITLIEVEIIHVMLILRHWLLVLYKMFGQSCLLLIVLLFFIILG